jgi:hypothetical protein
VNLKADNQSRTLARFRADTAEHQLEVLQNNGLYRHLKFSRGGSSIYRFDIITWPGYLAITGDMGESVFTRLPDMLEFFRTDQRKDEAPETLTINPGYWAEKCVANKGEMQEFRAELLEQTVKESFDNFIADNMVDGEDGAPDTQPKWASQLWIDLRSEVLSLENESVAAAIEAMDNYRPDSDTGFARFRFREPWEYASSMQDYTFHFYWRLYAIAFAVKAYDSWSDAQ